MDFAANAVAGKTEARPHPSLEAHVRADFRLVNLRAGRHSQHPVEMPSRRHTPVDTRCGSTHIPEVIVPPPLMAQKARPMMRQTRSDLLEIGLNSAGQGQSCMELINVGRVHPKLAEFGPASSGLGTISVDVGRIRPRSAELSSNLVEIGPNSVDACQTWPSLVEIGQNRVDVDQNLATSVDAGPKLAELNRCQHKFA